LHPLCQALILLFSPLLCYNESTQNRARPLRPKLEGLTMARILTTAQAADLLQVDADTVRKWLRRGRIPGRRIARDWRIPEDALLEWIQNAEARGNGADTPKD